MRANLAVGRVGGLAVALGVGAAVAMAAPAAWADDGGGGPPGSSSSAGDASATRKSESRPQRTTRGTARSASAGDGPRSKAVTLPVTARPGRRSALGGNGSGDPIESPATWVMAAVARRELADTGGETTLTTAAVVDNQPPVVGTVTVGRPSSLSGRVRGTVRASDPEDDPLVFSVPPVSTNGAAVQINSATGAFTYTPGAAVRHAAAVPGAGTDLITVSVSDDRGGTAPATITVPISPTNIRPRLAWAPTVTGPDPATGAVSGTLNARDADRDLLTFTAVPGKGSIVFSAGGAFTYTPTAAARLAAAAPGAGTAVKFDTFSVAVSDGHGGTVTKSLKVPVAPLAAITPVTVIGSVAVDGDNPPASPVVSANGTRGVIASPKTDLRSLAATTGVVVFDPATGTQVGTTLTLAGAGRSPVISADGTRALVVTGVPDPKTGVYTSRVTVINTVTGAQIGTTITMDGQPTGLPVFAINDTRAVLVADTYNVFDFSGNASHTTGIAVIDTNTGTQTGSTLTLTGAASSQMLFGANDNRLFIAVADKDADTKYISRIAVLDVATGTQIGATLSLAGQVSNAQLLGADSSRALVTLADSSQVAGSTTRIAVMSTATGAQIGTTIDLLGTPVDSVLLDPTGTTALVTARAYDAATDTSTTRPLVVDTITGAAIGAPTVVAEAAFVSAILSPDGSRAVIVTQEYSSPYDTSTYTSRITVIDRATGNQVGTTVGLTGWSTSPVFSADGKRILFTAAVSDWGQFDGFVNTSSLVLVDSATGQQIGDVMNADGAVGAQFSGDSSQVLVSVYDRHTERTVVSTMSSLTGAASGIPISFTGHPLGTLAGGNSIITPLNADGSKALIGISYYDPNTAAATIRILVGNTTTGTTTGTAVSLPGDFSPYGAMQFSDDGKRVLIVVNAYDSFAHTANSRVLLVDTETGAQIGSTLALRGFASTRFSSDGRHLLITSNDGSTDIGQAAVYDVITGAQTGSTLTFDGSLQEAVTVDADGRHALLVIASGSQPGTEVVSIDTVTGNQSGSTANLTGSPTAVPTVVTAGDRAVVTTAIPTSLTTTTTRVSVLQI